MRGKHLVEGTDKTADGPTAAPRVLRRIDQHETVMRLPAVICRVGQGNKVSDVLSDDGSSFLLSQGKQVGV